MTPVQCRMARAALKWSTQKLAEMSGVTAVTVNRFENEKDAFTSTANKLRETLEATGKIRFEGSDTLTFLGDLSN